MKFKATTMIMMMSVMFMAGAAFGQIGVGVSPPTQVVDFTVPTGFYSLSSSASAGVQEVLIIPGDDPMTAEEMATTTENMQIMTRIFETKLHEKNLMYFSAVNADLGNWRYTGTNTSDDIESIYLKGYGALFLLKTDFSLLPPVEKPPEPPKQAKDELWNKVRQNLTAPPTRSRIIAGTTQRRRSASVKEYNEEKVEAFKQTLLESLVHAGNMSHLADNEWVVIHVTGAGREVVEADKEIDVKVDAVSDSGVDFTVSREKQDFRPFVADPAFRGGTAAGKPTHLLIRARKTYINDLGDEVITFEEFKKEVTTIIY